MSWRLQVMRHLRRAKLDAWMPASPIYQLRRPMQRREDPSMTVTARADVPTEAPDRYAKQLLSHLGHRVTWTTDGETSTAELAGGTGRIVVGDGVITLVAEAPDAEALARVQHVLGSHLERFAQRQELQVTWTGADTPGGAPTPPAPEGHRRPGDRS
jgi:hypothetical protein